MKGTLCRNICPHSILKPMEQELQSKDIERGDRGLDQPFDWKRLRVVSVYLHHCLGVRVEHDDSFRDRDLGEGEVKYEPRLMRRWS